LTTLVADENVEVRCAAILVLTAIAARDAKVTQTVGAALQGRNAIARDFALGYFEQVQPSDAVDFLLPLLDDSDEAVRRRAAQVLAGYGSSTIDAVKPLIVDAPRRRITAIIEICSLVASPAAPAAMDLLFFLMNHDDFETHRAACDQLIAVLPRLDAKGRRDVGQRATKLLKNAKGHRTPTVAAAKLLGALAEPAARQLLLPLLDKEYAHSIRTHAAAALVHVLRGQALASDELRFILPLLEEDDEAGIVRPALTILDEQTLDRSFLPQLNRLAEVGHPLVRRFAVQKLGTYDSAPVVSTLIGYLTDESFARRDQAVASLKKLPAARMPLMNELLSSDDERKAWTLAEILLGHDRNWKPSVQEALQKRLGETLEKRDDRLYTAYFHLLSHLDPEAAWNYAKKRASAQHTKGHHGIAAKYLMLLKDSGEFADDERFLLAVCELKAKKHGLLGGVRRNDTAIDQLRTLARSTFAVADRLIRDGSLVPEELFFIGFNLAEGNAEEKSVAVELFEHLVSKHGRSKTGKSAKNKLKLMGLGT